MTSSAQAADVKPHQCGAAAQGAPFELLDRAALEP